MFGETNAAGVLRGTRFDLVWENSNPTSNFAATTIDIDLSDYDAVFITFRSSTSSDSIMATGISLMGDSTIFRYISYSGSNLRLYGRGATASSSGITFSAATYRTQGSSSETTANDRFIPVRAYAVKFA